MKVIWIMESPDHSKSQYLCVELNIFNSNFDLNFVLDSHYTEIHFF